MKISWGTGIFIILILFIIGMIGFLIFAFQQKTDLVEENYYPSELVYQKQIDRIRNANALEENIKTELSENHLIIRFPMIDSLNKPEGSIHIYRPSDEDIDIKVAIALSSDFTQTIKVSDLPKGKYLLKILWSWNEVEYYKEETLFLP